MILEEEREGGGAALFSSTLIQLLLPVTHSHRFTRMCALHLLFTLGLHSPSP